MSASSLNLNRDNEAYFLDSSRQRFEKGERIGGGAVSEILLTPLKDNQGNPLVVKVIKIPPDFELREKDAKKEAELLQRLYPDVRVITLYVGGIPAAPAIVMPRFTGEKLQEVIIHDDKENPKHKIREYKTPTELKDCSFSERAKYIYQLYHQLNKLHAPNPPARPAVIGDLNPENVMIDFNKKVLRLFDFGPAIFVPSGVLVKKPAEMEFNAVSRSPEVVHQNKIGLVSDIYGSIPLLMLLLGAKNPGAIKEKTKPGQNIKEKDPTQILTEEFDTTGLLEGFELPEFVIPLKQVILGLIQRMKEQNPEDRLQTAAELEIFWDIMKGIVNTPVKDAKDSDYVNAARLIVITSGCGNLLTLSDFNNREDCEALVNSYRVNPENCLIELRNKYADYTVVFIKIIDSIYPNHGPQFQGTPNECKEIFLAYTCRNGKEDEEALKLRLQLASLIDLLSANIKSEKKDKLQEIRNRSREDYLDQEKTMKLFREVCEVAVRTSIGESTTGKELCKILNDNYMRYAELVAKYLSPTSGKEVAFDDLYKFGTSSKRIGLLEKSFENLQKTNYPVDLKKFTKPR